MEGRVARSRARKRVPRVWQPSARLSAGLTWKGMDQTLTSQLALDTHAQTLRWRLAGACRFDRYVPALTESGLVWLDLWQDLA